MSSSGTKSTSNDSSTYEFPASESLDSVDLSSSLELFRTSSSSRTPLAAFPRAWLRTHLVKSALRPLILRPCCFKYIFSWLFVSASTSSSFFQEMLDGRVFLSLALFSPLHPRTQGALHTFYTQSRPQCTGNRALAMSFLQRRTIFRR